MDRNNQKTAKPVGLSANRRLYVWYGTLIFIFVVIVFRLFYLQIVRHDYYQQQAYNDQLKQYTVAPERGIIEAHQGTGLVPIVLNQKLYTLYADPAFIKNADDDARKVASVVGGDVNKYVALMKTPKSRYQVLGKRLTEDQKNKIAAFKLPGIGTQAIDYRTYPQGTLAAQLLGFVNDDGRGIYGVEQALNKDLSGTPGLLKAITDVKGIPLAANKNNVQIDPTPGKTVALTIDLAMQKQLESYLKAGVDRAKSSSASALIMDPYTGAIKAMANIPTYDPAQYFKVTDSSVFNNAAVSAPLEIGSIMKVLTTASALDQGVVTPDTAYDDPGHWTIDGSVVKNVEEDGGPGRHSIAQVLNLSMNTGATWMLMQMGGGQLNQQGRDKWHDYLVNHYLLGKPTGIEQGYEASGYIPDPNKGYGLNLTYANTTFGQALTATPLQMAAALSAIINGGTYYKPYLIDQTISGGQTKATKPSITKQNVVSPKVSEQMQSLMEYVVQQHMLGGASYLRFPANYMVGGKTGTAQIADPAGGYYGDRFNGTYMGFVGGDKPQYVIAVRVSEPHIGGYAGSTAAQPLFADLAHMLINNFNVTPKTGN